MLKIVNVTQAYQSQMILEDISFDIEEGSLTSVLGASGSGKTTLLNVLLGIVPISSGQIFWQEKEITHLAANQRQFNVVFQDYALFSHINVLENIRYGLRNLPKKAVDETYVAELINLLGLEKHLNKTIDQLSGGQKQRVALARTLAVKPKVLLLDEPLAALDSVIKDNIKQKIRSLVDDLKITTIMVTHDPEEAMTISDKVLLLDEGRIVQYDTPKNIIHSPQTAFVQHFLLDSLQRKFKNIEQLFAGAS